MGPGFTSLPVLSLIFYQCLSFIPYFLNATIKGTFGLNSSNYALTYSDIFKIYGISFSLNYRDVYIKTLIESSTNFSAAEATKSSQLLFSHYSTFFAQYEAISHKLLYV